MPQEKPAQRFRLGQRVSRQKGGERLGIVVGVDRKIKVKWDDGATSYYDLNKPANVRSAISKRVLA